MNLHTSHKGVYEQEEEALGLAINIKPELSERLWVRCSDHIRISLMSQQTGHSGEGSREDDKSQYSLYMRPLPQSRLMHCVITVWNVMEGYGDTGLLSIPHVWHQHAREPVVMQAE